MTVTDEKHGDIRVLAPEGRIDSVTSPALEEILSRALAGGDRRFVLDLAGVDYISSAGLRVLLVAAKQMRETKGTLVLCALNQPVRQVFELAGFMPLFTLEPSRDRALARAGAAV